MEELYIQYSLVLQYNRAMVQYKCTATWLLCDSEARLEHYAVFALDRTFFLWASM